MELITQYGPWMLLGLAASQLFDFLSSATPFSQFNAKKWVDDNGRQLLFSLVCCTALLAMGDTLFPLIHGGELNASTAFWAGVGSDSTTNYFKRRIHKLRQKDEQ